MMKNLLKKGDLSEWFVGGCGKKSKTKKKTTGGTNPEAPNFGVTCSYYIVLLSYFGRVMPSNILSLGWVLLFSDTILATSYRCFYHPLLTNISHKKAHHFRRSQRWFQKSLSPPKTHGSVVSMNCIWRVSTIQTRWTHPIFHWTMIFHDYGRKVSSLPRLGGTPNHQPSIKNPRVKRASRIWS